MPEDLDKWKQNCIKSGMTEKNGVMLTPRGTVITTFGHADYCPSCERERCVTGPSDCDYSGLIIENLCGWCSNSNS